jgi:hypothetical protein
MLGGLNPVKWIDDLLPEMLWLGMLNNDHGHRRGVQLADLSAAEKRFLKAALDAELARRAVRRRSRRK